MKAWSYFVIREAELYLYMQQENNPVLWKDSVRLQLGG